jgi:hypothetical protein
MAWGFSLGGDVAFILMPGIVMLACGLASKLLLGLLLPLTMFPLAVVTQTLAQIPALSKRINNEDLRLHPIDDARFDHHVDDHPLGGGVGDWCGWQGAVRVGDADAPRLHLHAHAECRVSHPGCHHTHHYPATIHKRSI